MVHEALKQHCVHKVRSWLNDWTIARSGLIRLGNSQIISVFADSAGIYACKYGTASWRQNLGLIAPAIGAPRAPKTRLIRHNKFGTAAKRSALHLLLGLAIHSQLRTRRHKYTY